MAKAPQTLSFIDIVTKADADVIRQALEARVKIDELLVIREEAYKKIFDIETEIDEICGDEGVFDFGDAPYPVAGLTKPVVKKAATKSAEKTEPVSVKTEEDSTEES